MRKFASVVIAGLLAALLTPLGPISTASAAPAAPSLTQPANGASVDSNPVLRWTAAASAVKYEVQVANNQTFSGTLAFTSTTAGTSATPLADLPLATYYWRVRGVDSAGVAGPYAVSSFEKVTRSAPTPTYPVNRSTGNELLYPDDSLYFKWSPFPGAKSYEVQIGTDPLFTGAPAPVAVPNTRYAPLTPPAFNTEFWWRVRAKSANNVYSDWSVATAYTMKWTSDTPVELVSPASRNTPSIEEVVLTWKPKPGAAYYEVQVSPDQNFNNPIIKGSDNTRGRKVVGTRLADNDSTGSDMLNLPAGAYYWRVRAMSTSTNAEPGPWSSVSTFTRAWPGADPAETARPNGTDGVSNPFSQVALTYPADGVTLTQPRFEWTPQRGAAEYEVQFSSDSAFSPARVASCFTDHTRLTPLWRVEPNGSTSCYPKNASGELLVVPGVVTYWRVRALDGPQTPAVNGNWTTARNYLYDPASIQQLSPANGSTVGTPILRWTAVPNLSKYKVTFDGVGTGCNDFTVITHNTTYVPEALNPACDGYWLWTVQGVEDDNNAAADGPETRVSLGGWWKFTWTPPTGVASAPSPVTQTSEYAYRPPVMQWPAVNGAAEYEVWYSKAGFNSYTMMNKGTSVNAYAFAGDVTGQPRLLSPGVYDFFVRAKAADGATIGTSPNYQFTIADLLTATPTAPANCPLNSCTSVERDTPTFTWNSVDGAGLYVVYLATDATFTNITHEFHTRFTTLTPPESLPDSQAGQATYWFVRPCYDLANCGRFDGTNFNLARAFRKTSVPVKTLTPVSGATVGTDPAGNAVGDVTFSWEDYLLENQVAGVTQEAAFYELQVSTTANFTTVIDASPRIDVTEYTADLKTYPNGPLYWRVQAFDNTGNPLTFSTPLPFTKAVAGPKGLAPNSIAVKEPTPILTWTAQAFATQYEVEVYKSTGDPSAALSPVNRVATIKTRLPSAIPTTALAAGQYSWRVRMIDINNNAGRWSSDSNPSPNLDGALAHFVVGSTGPTLVTPAQGASVNGSTVDLSWNPVDAATRYRLEVSSVSNFSTLIESATTDMTAYSPDLLTPVWPNGTIYWRVHALDANGVILTTSLTRSFTRDASTAGEYTAVAPYRVLDSRTNGGALGEGRTRTVTMVGGSTGIPKSGVSAVVLNATVTGPTKASYLTLWPAGTTKPTVSALNFVAGQTVANHATVPVDAAGRLTMYNNRGTTQVILDVVGYYSNGSLQRANRYTPAATPTRIADTRGGGGQAARPLAAGEARVMEVAGLGGVPADAKAVVMNVTAVSPTKEGYFTVYPAGGTRPTASSLNFKPNATVPNLVTMPLGTGGDVMVFNSAGSTHLLMDVVGWYLAGDPAPGTRMSTVTPTRIADTRGAEGPRLGAASTRSFQIRGKAGIPSTATGVVLNVTIVAPRGNGYATVFPSGNALPTASNLNYANGQTVSNQVIARIGADGKVNVYSLRSADVILDVVGWLG